MSRPVTYPPSAMDPYRLACPPPPRDPTSIRGYSQRPNMRQLTDDRYDFCIGNQKKPMSMLKLSPGSGTLRSHAQRHVQSSEGRRAVRYHIVHLGSIQAHITHGAQQFRHGAIYTGRVPAKMCASQERTARQRWFLYDDVAEKKRDIKG